MCIGNRKINLSTVFAVQNVGIREVAEKIWLARKPDRSFIEYDLEFFDEVVGRVEPPTNPFVPEL
jgi:putative transposase